MPVHSELPEWVERAMAVASRWGVRGDRLRNRLARGNHSPWFGLRLTIHRVPRDFM